ncbi:hypothetical protein N7499_003311 [Penicillium canescens]|uniref:Uncharacterized protein n=1 Tax=Penicillium canescens TaxID=5083 RepID=A0AAD6I9L3_PENCN|nr:uncharacterized protein N7446_012216 [Penicillium canescens]KAJ6020010.1 hypothetical protein N7522_000085 [Penicillium canescens]KAJ6037945.1 hypothetical protein N7460_007716 [Penicillium canescens]KAJ6045352.1 hypothetical protein N7446_012216 [Penicillium canescens]KAJ6061051.1 hypothetical protein N7444_001747 [Penicillium canescens]KAJ6086394.1 hypothetical protein N7499_004307 [Penicillium canescens]
MYAMSSLISYERFVDKVSANLWRRWPTMLNTDVHSIKRIESRKIGKLPQFTINDVIGTNIGAGSDTTAQNLSYLQVTIKEASRLHAGVVQILSRLVTEGGAQIVGDTSHKV